MSDYKRIRAIIAGYVQGVGFRWFTVRTAQRLGLTGWVRNNPDGTVETVAEGQSDAINQFIGEIRRGPASSTVSNVSYTEEQPTHEFGNFDVKFS